MKVSTFFKGFMILPLFLFSSVMIAQPDSDVQTDDSVILDDLIVDGSACIGVDCVNGESFGFDTIRLKENNLRIKFQDTSTSASFPSNDWQLTANDSSNGGANKFSIDDIDGGRTPFTIEAGAPSHSLFVDDGGRVGFGISTPVVELHTRDGNTPTLRLEQDGSDGFTPQTWDVAGNETNFFIRDATNGSPLPFRIRPSAPQNSIFVDTDGDIGLGTASPVSQLHLLESAAATTAQVTIESQAAAVVQLESTAASAIFYRSINSVNSWANGTLNTGNYIIRNITDGNAPAMEIDRTTNNITTEGTITANSVLLTSDLRLKDNINSFDDGLNIIRQMKPITYRFTKESGRKTNKEFIGFGAQDLQKIAPYTVDIFANNKYDAKGDLESSQDNLAIDHFAITTLLVNSVRQQQDMIEERDQIIENLEAEVAELSSLREEFDVLKDRFEEIADFMSNTDVRDVLINGEERAFLTQNSPNPYHDETLIEYFIPSKVGNAEIQFLDPTGKLLKKISIQTQGKGQVNLTARDLPTGAYHYSLIIDGEVVDTKKMILQK